MNVEYMYWEWVVLSLALCVAVAMAEADRLWDQQSAEEAYNLSRDFTGDLRDAKSSVESDREKILCELELSGQEHRVKLAIEVLLTSGMSTPSLQAAAETVGLLEQAGYWNLSITSMIWVMWFASSLVELANYYRTSLQSGYPYAWIDARGGPPFVRWQFWVLVFSCLQALVWLGRFKCQGKDTRGFAASAMVKLMGPFVIWNIIGESNFGMVGLHLVLAPLVLMLCFAGPGGTVKVPVLGRRIVRCLMMRWSCGCSRCSKVCVRVWCCKVLCGVVCVCAYLRFFFAFVVYEDLGHLGSGCGTKSMYRIVTSRGGPPVIQVTVCSRCSI